MPKSPSSKRKLGRGKSRSSSKEAVGSKHDHHGIVSIELRSDAFTAPTQVFNTESRRDRPLATHSLSVVGVAQLEYVHTYEEPPGSYAVPQLFHGIVGIDDGGHVIDDEAELAADEENQTESSRVQERAMRRTRRLLRSASCWSDFFEPLSKSLREVVDAAVPAELQESCIRDLQGLLLGMPPSFPQQLSGLACAQGHTYGYGHPEIRQLQRLSDGHFNHEAFTETADRAVREFLQQCCYSSGALAMDTFVEIVRLALRSQPDAVSRRAPGERRRGTWDFKKQNSPPAHSLDGDDTPRSTLLHGDDDSPRSSMASTAAAAFGTPRPSNRTSVGLKGFGQTKSGSLLRPERLSICDEEDDDEALNDAMADGADPARQRAALLRSMRSSMEHMMEISCATRAESPDIQIQFLEVGIADMAQEFFLARNKPGANLTLSPSGSRRASRRVRIRPGSAVSWGSGGSSGERSARGSTRLDNSEMKIEDRESPTPSGSRRLQFWDGFFSYRELGAVSRELAANQLVHDADSDEDGGAPLSYLRSLGSKRNHAVGAQRSAVLEEDASPFASKPMVLNSASTASLASNLHTSSRTLDDPLSVFPALGKRRKHPDICALRRPPGATAETPVRTRGTLAAERSGNAALAAPGRSNTSGLPPLVLAAQSALSSTPRGRAIGARSGTFQRPAVGAESSMPFGQSGDRVSLAERLDLPVPPGGSEPFVLPMFMSGTEVQKQEEGKPLAFINNGVGFELQPLAQIQGEKREAQKSSGTTTSSHNKKSDQNEQHGRQTTRTWGSSAKVALSGGEDHTADGEHDDVPPRCQYCTYHGTPLFKKAPPVAVRKRQAGIRALQQRQRRGSQLGTNLPDLCAACGGDLDTPFYPRPPKIPGDVSLFLAYTSEGSTQPLTSLRGSPESSPGDSPRGSPRGNSKPQGGLHGSNGLASAMALDTGAESPLESSEARLEKSALKSEERHRGGAGRSFSTPRNALNDNLDTDSVVLGGVYFIACERNRARPLADAAAALMESGALHDPSLSASSRSLGGSESGVVISMRGAELDDKGLSAFIASLTQKGSDFAAGGIHIDFARNRLTDHGVCNLLGTLEEPLDWAKRLESVDFAGNRLLTAAGLNPLCDLLVAEKLPRLRCLRLGGIELPDCFAKRLFTGIEVAASGNLEELDISFMGLGRSGPMGPQAAALLLRQCQALCNLDVSGNHLHFEALTALGSALADAGSVQTVHIAHNTGNWPIVPGIAPASFEEFSKARVAALAGGKDGREGNPFPPVRCAAVCALCEFIPRVHNLRLLDLRDSQVDPRCAFMLANVLSIHPKISSVLLNGNPLGQYGVRVLLSLAYLAVPPVGSAEGHLMFLSLDHCMEDSMLALDTPPLSPADPSGSYSLDLRDPWARAAVQYCLKRWSNCRPEIPFEQAFPYMELDGKAWRDVSQDQEGMWEVPSSGILSFTFLMPFGDAAGNDKFRIRPQDRHRRTLSAPEERRALRIAATCRAVTSLVAVIHALSTDFWLRAGVVRTLLAWLRSMGAAGATAQSSAADVLYDSLAVTEDDPDLLELLLSTRVAPVKQILRDHRSTLDFIVCANPTGHYVLNLTWPSERLAAEDLLRTNSWEVEMAKAQGMPDLSQKGNYQFLRNEAFEGRSFVYHPDWMLPTRGVLEFDMAVPRRPAKSMRSMPEESFQRLMEVLTGDNSPVVLRVLCLWRVSPSLYLSCQQVLNVFQVLSKANGANGQSKRGGLPQPVEQLLFAIFVFRIKDYQNTRQVLFKSPGPFSNSERARACEHAIGVLNMADPPQIHNHLFHCRLDLYEERQFCRMLLAIAYAEGGRVIEPKSFTGCAYGPDISALHNMSAPPEHWAKASLPLQGVLRLNYLCEPEGTGRIRKVKAQQVCGWDA